MDLHLLRALNVFLESQSWVERECQPTDHGQDAEVKHAVELLSSQFQDPLEAASVSPQDEMEDVVVYSRAYFRLNVLITKKYDTIHLSSQTLQSGLIFCSFASWLSACHFQMQMLNFFFAKAS